MHHIPLLDLKLLYDRQAGEIRAAMDRVLESQEFIMGPEVAAFERDMEAFLGGEARALGCSSGSAALVLVLMALGIGPGDEVIVPPYSFFATASCVALVGATIVWADVEPGSLNIDPAQVAAKITPRTRAIVAVHLFGRMADMDGLAAAVAASGQEITLIEDAAQSLGAAYKGRRSCTIGEAGCTSFFPSKNLGCFGDGGLVTARDEALAKRVDILRKHGAEQKYFHDVVGLNSRLDALQAAILRVKLPALQGWCDERRANAARYRDLFAQTRLDARVTLPADDGPDGAYHHIYNQFNLLVDDRDGLQAHLKAQGIGTAVYYPRPLHLQPCFASTGAQPGECPVSEAAALRALAIPVYPGLEPAQQEAVVEAIASYYA